MKPLRQMTRKQTHNILLLSIVFISQLHVLFRGIEYRVDWFIFIDYTRRIDYAVMYLCKHITQIVLAYCVLYPKNVSKQVSYFIFIICCFDLVHFFTTSSIGYGAFKILISTIFFFLTKHRVINV